MFERRFIASILLIGLFSVVLIGCKSQGGSSLSNPFVSDRQTVPPPATFSHQQSYLGQTPGSYTPQSPATTYNTPSTAVPATTSPTPTAIPPNVPLPSGSTTSPTTYGNGASGGYGSINNSGNGATLFQTSGVNPSPATTAESGWAPSTTPASVSTGANINSTYTSDTAFRNIDAQLHTVTTVAADGTVSRAYTDPESLIVSSSQIITQIGDIRAPEAIPSEPKSLYATEYQ